MSKNNKVKIFFLSFLISLGCSKKSENPVCSLGLNSSTCDEKLIDHSAWEDEIKVSYKDEKTGGNIERSIRTIYQFWSGGLGPKIKRSVFVKSSDEDKVWSMSQLGSMEDLNSENFNVIFEETICYQANTDYTDDFKNPPEEQKLYFKREGGNLELSTVEIIKMEKPKGFFENVVGSMAVATVKLVAGITKAITETLIRSILNLSEVRGYLYSGNHELKQVDLPLDDSALEVYSCAPVVKTTP